MPGKTKNQPTKAGSLARAEEGIMRLPWSRVSLGDAASAGSAAFVEGAAATFSLARRCHPITRENVVLSNHDILSTTFSVEKKSKEKDG